LIQNWQREIEGAFLYGQLSKLTRFPELQKALAQMSEDEEKHAAFWAERIKAVDATVQPPKPDLRIRLTVWIARWLGPQAVLKLLLKDEVSDIAAYTDQAMTLGDTATYQQVLADESAHARSLAALREQGISELEEPWHRGAGAGGVLRNIVYGFNDGLTANFGLVMGVVGANVHRELILLTGFAGMVADALSMASSGFLAAKSEEEVRQHHLTLEQAELTFMPEEERRELATYFVRKGLTPAEAAGVADRMMENPAVALAQLAREELGYDPEAPKSPLSEGTVTGIATTLGAAIPIVPFLLFTGATAVWIGIVISMIAHFAVGASRAIFTGRPAIRSGFEMFVVGMGVAIATYLLGKILGVGL